MFFFVTLPFWIFIVANRVCTTVEKIYCIHMSTYVYSLSFWDLFPSDRECHTYVLAYCDVSSVQSELFDVERGLLMLRHVCTRVITKRTITVSVFVYVCVCVQCKLPYVYAARICTRTYPQQFKWWFQNRRGVHLVRYDSQHGVLRHGDSFERVAFWIRAKRIQISNFGLTHTNRRRIYTCYLRANVVQTMKR